MPLLNLDELDGTNIEPQPKRSITDYFSGLTIGAEERALQAGSNLLRTGGAAIDVLSRPAYALREGFGAVKAGANPLQALGAAWRGLSEGESGLKYPSIGDQIAPHDEFAKGVIDFVADPLLFLPVGRLTRFGLAAAIGSKPARAAGKAITEFARVSPAMQKFAQVVLPLGSHLSFYGGQFGKEIRTGIAEALTNQSLHVGRRERDFARLVKQLGLGGAGAKQARLAVTEVLRTGRASGVKQIDELAAFIRRDLDGWQDTFRKFRDLDGLGIEEIDKTARETRKRLYDEFKEKQLPKIPRGQKQAALKAFRDHLDLAHPDRIPFQGLPNYVPQMFNDEAIQMISARGRSPSSQAKLLAKQLQITEGEAQDIIHLNMGRPTRAGNIEYQRLRNIPDKMLELDPLAWYPRYVSQASRRLTHMEQFGRDFQHLDKQLKGAIASGLDEKIAGRIRQAIRDPVGPEGTFWTKKTARQLTGAMVMTKMGWTSALANISQSANTIIVDGTSNFLAGLWRSRDPIARQRAIVAYHGSIRNTMEHLLGVRPDSLPERYLRWTGFTPAETINRVLAANSGVVTAERMVAEFIELQSKGKLLPKELKRLNEILEQMGQRGVTSEAMTEFAKKGRFSAEIEERIGLLAANRTQHATTYLDVPIAWRSPEARVFTQYKSFIYQQSRFLGREIGQPLIRYIVTDGKEGSVLPLMRAAAAFGIAGEVVAELRSAMRRQDRKIDKNHPLMQMIDTMAYVGAFGMASDVVDNAIRGNLVRWAAGPTAGDVEDLARSLALTGKDLIEKGETPSSEDVMKGFYRRFGRGALPLARPFFEGK